MEPDERSGPVKFTDYPQGSPCWNDLSTSDLEAAKAFYSGLFGWEIPDGDPNYGGYTLAHLGGDAVAGLGPVMQADEPVAWNTYFHCADLDATLAAVTGAGGSVLADPMEIGDQGRMAVCADPAGAAFGLWQPGVFPGAGVANEPNTWSWSELRTGDADAATDFYRAAFPVISETSQIGDVAYTTLTAGGRSVAGIMPMGDYFPAGTPPHWMTFFAVADVEAAAEAVGKLGGQTVGPIGAAEGIGRWIAATDPQGGMFMLAEVADPPTS
jgi:predicted enzyme related to lactoylglutathione lyase